MRPRTSGRSGSWIDGAAVSGTVKRRVLDADFQAHEAELSDEDQAYLSEMLKLKSQTT